MIFHKSMGKFMNNEYVKIISERLREERLRLDLKQTDILRQIDVAISTFSNYETGKRSPDLEFIMKLGALGYDVAYIVTGERHENGAVVLPPDEQEWLNLYRKMASDDRERLIKMAKSLL